MPTRLISCWTWYSDSALSCSNKTNELVIWKHKTRHRNRTALGTARTSATPHRNGHSVVTAEQQMHRPSFSPNCFRRPFLKRFALCYRAAVLSRLSSLSVTLVYCGQTVRWIKMKLGVKVGLGPRHTVLDGDSAPTQKKGHSSQFSAHVCCGQNAGWIKMPLGTDVGLGPGDIVLDGDPAPPKRGHIPNFWHMSTVAKRLDASEYHLVRR